MPTDLAPEKPLPQIGPEAGGVPAMSDLRATYRLQLRGDVDLDTAREIVDYLDRLGVSHLYSSPVFGAAPGSTHGYDVVDPGRVDPAIGGAPALGRLVAALRQRDMGLVVDIVPNHMAIAGQDNPWWWDVLENGPSSRYAPYFDVDWDPPESYLRNRILMPILADHYGRVLEAGGIRLERDGAGFVIRAGEQRLPVAPRSIDVILGPAAKRGGSDELAFLAVAFAALPSSAATDRASVRRRHRDKEVLRRLLSELLAREPVLAELIDEVVDETNADADALDRLLDRQNYRLAFWRAADRDLGYRRFFDVTSLVALRAEDEQVFAETHAAVLEWIARGWVQGLRVDHPDGLRDPAEYLRCLREAAPASWIVTEKILSPGERLRADWPVDGTTGYDFLGLVGGLFVDPAAETAMGRLYRDFTGDELDFEAAAREGKRTALRDLLGSELNRLTALFLAVCERQRRYRDYTRHELHEALRAAAVSFPVYRTYVRAEAGEIDDQDRATIDGALASAAAERQDLDPGLFELLGQVLRLEVRGESESELVMRFQQLTGAAMAKGVEDTAFYRWVRLASLNEVGDDPSRFGVAPEAFHRWCVEAAQRGSSSMLATSTHDTKRGEDVRLRIHALTEDPERWAEAVGRWRAANERHRRGDAPDRALEYLYYQTLVGTWPIEAERMTAYLTKAAREAKVRTSWTAPDAAFEADLAAFVAGTLADPAFRAEVSAFSAGPIAIGRISSLAQVLLKLTAPGIPDLYQGTELWDVNLVDPDNRRPVDFALRRRLLDRLESIPDAVAPEQALDELDTGLPKLWTVRRALEVRRGLGSLFAPGSAYEPLAANGTRAGHVVAFLRGGGAITVVPRLVGRLGGDWADTRLDLPAGFWRNAMTGDSIDGGSVAVAGLLARFPVALLVRERFVDRS